MQEWLIYQHINKVNGKSYIGQTTNLKRRIGKNGKGYLSKNSKGEYKQRKFAYAILKYGWDNFRTVILKEHLTLEEANYYEAFYIEQFQTINSDYGYNIKLGGNNSSPSKETREKMKEARKNWSQEAHKHCSDAQKGKKLSKETKEKISEAVSGEKHPRYRKHPSEETKEKIRETNKIKSTFVKNNPRKRKVVCVETREIFESCKEAQQYFCPTATDGLKVSESCRKGRKVRAINNFHFKYLEDIN